MRIKPSLLVGLLIIIVVVSLTGCSVKAENEGSDQKTEKKVVVNIGTQGISLLNLSHEKGWIDEAFAKAGAELVFTDFQSGPPHFEAIASDRLDFGLVGNGPPIGGQAGNIEFKEIAVVSDGKKGNSLLIQGDSSIQSVADLKGKKVAVAKGSSAFALLYRAAAQVGLDPADIEVIQLQPDEAQPAFQTKAVDAWATWEPYVSIGLSQGGKELANGETLNLASPSFAITRNAFAKEHPELVTLFLAEYKRIIDWAKENPEEAIEYFANQKKIDPDLVRAVLKKTNYVVEPVSSDYIQAQQETADLLFETGGIKRKIDVSEVVDNQYVEKALNP